MVEAAGMADDPVSGSVPTVASRVALIGHVPNQELAQGASPGLRKCIGLMRLPMGELGQSCVVDLTKHRPALPGGEGETVDGAAGKGVAEVSSAPEAERRRAA